MSSAFKGVCFILHVALLRQFRKQQHHVTSSSYCYGLHCPVILIGAGLDAINNGLGNVLAPCVSSFGLLSIIVKASSSQLTPLKKRPGHNAVVLSSHSC